MIGFNLVLCVTFFVQLSCASTPCLLKTVFHEDLIMSHKFQSISSAAPSFSSWKSAHLEAYIADRADEAIPALCCGPEPDSAEAQQLTTVVGDLTTMLVDHDTREACYLLHAAPSTWTSLNEEQVWRVQMLPPLLKIHPSVLRFLDPHSSVAPASPSHAVPPPLAPPGVSTSTTEGEEVQGREEVSLVVQLVPHPGALSPEQTLAQVLDEWRGDHDLLRGAGYFATALEDFSGLGEGGEGGQTAWGALREQNAHRQQRRLHSSRQSLQQDGRALEDDDKRSGSDTSASAPRVQCSLPASAKVEYSSPSRAGGGLASILNLQDASSSSSSSMSSNYCFMTLVETLSLHSSVMAVSVAPRMRALNHHARGVVQSGQSGWAPLTAAGLLGTGQVVGVADTGLDDSSCFFRDNSGKYSSGATARDGSVQSQRRKVVQYSAYADSSDGVAGHGTHVAGSIVGEALSKEFAFANGKCSAV